MKKKFLVLLFVCAFALLPFSVSADSLIDNYNHKNFTETLADEEIELENKDYKENDKQAIIYMFRGKGCGYCKKFLNFLNSISTEYGQYFKLISFEVWNDATNAELFKKVPLVTNEPAGGVPYIIIGEKVFAGYAEAYDQGIKDAIMAQYNDSSYDVMEKLDERLNGETSSSGKSSTFVIFWNAAIVIAATVALIVVNNNNTKRVLAAIEKNNTKEVKETKKAPKKEEK